LFLRVLWQSMFRRKRRKAAAVAAVWIGVTLISAFLCLSISVGDQMNRQMRSFGADIRIEPAGAAVPVRVGGYQLAPVVSHAYLPAGDIRKLKMGIFWKNNILGIVPRLETEAEDGTRTVSLLGVWFSHRMKLPGGDFETGARSVYKDWSIRGRWPSSAGECLVGDDLARSLHVSLGDKLVLKAGSRRAIFRITGLLQTGGPEDGEVVASLHAVQGLAGLRGKLSRVDISALTTPEDDLVKRHHETPASLTPADYERWSCTAYAGGIALSAAKAFPGSVASVVRRVSLAKAELLKKIEKLMALLAVLIAIASVLSVAGVLASAVLERRGEAALLQAIGAKRWNVLMLFLAEAAMIGLTGGLLAALTGPFLGSTLIGAVFDAKVPPPFVSAAVGPLIGVSIALFATFRPVLKTLSASTAEMLHAG
jgi:putative ABC transport system permease protein